MGQSHAHQWMHVLLPALLTALVQRFGVAEADAAPVVVPPCAHDGTERRIVRPQDPAAQAACESGKTKDHTVKHVLLVNALLLILVLRDTSGGRTHEKPMADATPSPWPAGSRLLQDSGFLVFTLPQGAILMPTRKPCGQERPLVQQRANQALPHCRRRIAPVTSSVKRCRIVKDWIRLRKDGVRTRVMARGCALQNGRVRLTPGPPVV